MYPPVIMVNVIASAAIGIFGVARSRDSTHKYVSLTLVGMAQIIFSSLSNRFAVFYASGQQGTDGMMIWGFAEIQRSISDLGPYQTKSTTREPLSGDHACRTYIQARA